MADIKKIKNYDRIQQFSLMDDEFMSAALDGNIKAVELILKIILSELRSDCVLLKQAADLLRKSI